MTTHVGNYRHGAAVGGKVSPTYSSWRSMIQRCTNPKVRGYQDYGGRGIKVCARWKSFINFLADMGEKPPKRSIERRRNNEGYNPGNCFWGTASQQARNRRDRKLYRARGKSQTVAAWAEEVGLPFHVLQMRLTTMGWPVERAISTPVATAPVYKAFGEEKTLSQWAESFGVGRRLIEKRLSLGWGLERALQTRKLKRAEPLTPEEKKVRRQARNAIAQALRSRRMVRPDLCQSPGCVNRAENAHHHKGYAKEFWLDVKWVCRACHVGAEQQQFGGGAAQPAAAA